jgi:2,5-diketo-D-gluconate reductase A
MPSDVLPASVPTITLNNGVTIPQLGFGVFQIPPAETAAAVRTALEVGYRHIDTAQMYGNEKEVGQAIAESDLDPAEVFVTSKLNNRYHSYDDARRAFDGTLAALGAERIDLFLIHWPLPTVRDYTETWRALESIYTEGRARAVGVSNFKQNHLRKLHESSTIVPAVNQIELHPYLTQTDMQAFDAEHGIATEAWSPIAQGDVLGDPVVEQLARDHGKSTAQIVLRWHVQLGNIVIPKSVTRSRVEENFALFDFELSPSEMGLISALNKDERRGPDPEVFDWVPS